MLIDELMLQVESDMEEAVRGSQHELALIRTGRASLALVDGINIECYGGKSPLKQVASLSVPEARLVVIQPWDRSVLGEIEKALLKSDLGIPPNSDGKVIRLQIPPLTEDRRKELVKQVKKLGEEGKVKVRSVRRIANEEIREGENDGDIPKDEAKRTTEDIQKLTDNFIERIDAIIEDKSKEIAEF